MPSPQVQVGNTNLDRMHRIVSTILLVARHQCFIVIVVIEIRSSTTDKFPLATKAWIDTIESPTLSTPSLVPVLTGFYFFWVYTCSINFAGDMFCHRGCNLYVCAHQRLKNSQIATPRAANSPDKHTTRARILTPCHICGFRHPCCHLHTYALPYTRLSTPVLSSANTYQTPPRASETLPQVSVTGRIVLIVIIASWYLAVR